MKGDVGGEAAERADLAELWVSELQFDAVVKLFSLACNLPIDDSSGLDICSFTCKITLGWNLMQRNTCGLGTPQGRELDSLEPVCLHPLPKNSQQNPEVWKMGREEAGRKTTLPVLGQCSFVLFDLACAPY